MGIGVEGHENLEYRCPDCGTSEPPLASGTSGYVYCPNCYAPPDVVTIGYRHQLWQAIKNVLAIAFRRHTAYCRKQP